MLAAEGKKLIDGYLAWLREGYSFETAGGSVQLTTPFLDPHNDELQIYLEKQGDTLHLTDDGYTLADLKDTGLEINTDKRAAHVRQILNGFGVRQEGDQLVVSATVRDFPQKKHNLIQAMLAIHDLGVMGQAQVLQFFEEDVAAYLDEHHVPYNRQVKLAGKTGFDHHFDFIFPKLGRRSEAVMQAVNLLTRDLATSVAFAVNDVRLQRGRDDFAAYAVINDREATPAADHLDALKAYAIRPILWSQRQRLVADLLAN